MALQLFVKRAKIFTLTVDGVEKRCQINPNPGAGAQVAPDWIADTLTFKLGIKDKSIIDMTPPKRSASKHAAPAIDVAEQVSKATDPTNIGIDAVAALAKPDETPEPELAAFGGSKGPAKPKGLGGRSRP